MKESYNATLGTASALAATSLTTTTILITASGASTTAATSVNSEASHLKIFSL